MEVLPLPLTPIRTSARMRPPAPAPSVPLAPVSCTIILPMIDRLIPGWQTRPMSEPGVAQPTMSVPHLTAVRVYYEDTDFSGYVYHAGHLRFLERGRTEFLRALGATHTALQREESGLVFVVARLAIDYLKPAGMDDLLTVETAVVDARGPVIRFRQCLKREAVALSRAEVTVVTLRDGRPVRLPAALRERFAAASTPVPSR